MKKVLLIGAGLLLGAGLLASSSSSPQKPSVQGITISVTPAPSLTIVPTEIPTQTVISTRIPPTPTVFKAVLVPTRASTKDAGLSNDKYYTNSDGNTVHSPANSTNGSAPADATAQCKDGEYSFSQHRSGTCSGHGGVARWL